MVRGTGFAIILSDVKRSFVTSFIGGSVMLSRLRMLLSLKGQDRGFTLIELLIVVLIVGILAAVGVPLYFGYISDAKSVEGKSVAGALWTTVQANAIAGCGTATKITDAYARAGFDSAGATSDGRWKVTTAGSDVLLPCATGLFPTGDVFTITGQAADISTIVIKLNYDTTKTPASQLLCSFSGGTPTTKC